MPFDHIVTLIVGAGRCLNIAVDCASMLKDGHFRAFDWYHSSKLTSLSGFVDIMRLNQTSRDTFMHLNNDAHIQICKIID